MFQPPPQVTEADLLLKDLIAGGVKTALLEYEQTVNQPKLEKLLETSGEEFNKVARKSIDDLTQALEKVSLEKMEDVSKKLIEGQDNINKQTKKLLKAATKDLPGSLQNACSGLQVLIEERVSTILEAKLNEIFEGSYPLFDKICAMGTQAVEKFLMDIENTITVKFSHMASQLKESLQDFPLLTVAPRNVDQDDINEDDRRKPNEKRQQGDSHQNDSDSDCFITNLDENDGEIDVIPPSQLIDIQKRIAARSTNANETAGPSGMGKASKRKVTEPEDDPDDPPPPKQSKEPEVGDSSVQSALGQWKRRRYWSVGTHSVHVALKSGLSTLEPVPYAKGM
ncbi:Zinc finger CCCH domain-containing protein 19 [Frankliniella fusca]|uniref:Zinc finger CCCH domain-containing protein 19 n=1 Tax=Frankliniella fusca TaxID=407009 RepID=A0AAE1GSF9_9NEOP|nr:Zinc finger CCCH domain-containing protein 19 [Frankliniella fusca]